MKLYILFFMLVASLNGNIGTYGFKPFPNYYFVETGTFGGEAIFKALGTDCFQEAYSMEVDEGLFRGCTGRFKECKNVHIIHGDSATGLWNVIKDLDKPITFWLDAHIYPPFKDKKNCPLLEELDQIKKHPIKTHTILIDDMNCCSTLAFDYLILQELVKKIKEINPHYIIQLLDGGNDDEVKGNILCAIVPDFNKKD